jgi:iron(III) transport system ATP-binding protein
MELSLDHVDVRYPGAAMPALADVNLRLADGQIGALIGPSGCGKTTLLRAVAGLERIGHGRISVGGDEVSSATTHTAPEHRRVGMVFQDYALFPHLDIAHNIGFGLHHMPHAAKKERVRHLLELVGLAGKARSMPHELSGGQQQRVALARALAPRPKLLLLDEPFSNLDVELRERLAQEVRTILKTEKTTALLVTHDQLEAFALADEIGVMHQGQLHQWADAYSLYHRPATRFVAEFIGHGVFLPATVERHFEHGSEHRHVVTPLGQLHDVAPETLSSLAEGQCDLLLRADDIVHDDASPTLAQITRKAFRGNEFLYTLQLKTGQEVLAHVPSHHNHQVGEWIGIRAEVDHVVTFDRV